MAAQDVISVKAECLGRLLTGGINQRGIIDGGHMSPLIKHMPLAHTLLQIALNQGHWPRPWPCGNA